MNKNYTIDNLLKDNEKTKKMKEELLNRRKND